MPFAERMSTLWELCLLSVLRGCTFGTGLRRQRKMLNFSVSLLLSEQSYWLDSIYFCWFCFGLNFGASFGHLIEDFFRHHSASDFVRKSARDTHHGHPGVKQVSAYHPMAWSHRCMREHPALVIEVSMCHHPGTSTRLPANYCSLIKGL